MLRPPYAGCRRPRPGDLPRRRPVVVRLRDPEPLAGGTRRGPGHGLGDAVRTGPALATLLGLPDGVVTLGWLCLGWPDERPPAPGLERAGWSRGSRCGGRARRTAGRRPHHRCRTCARPGPARRGGHARRGGRSCSRRRARSGSSTARSTGRSRWARGPGQRRPGPGRRAPPGRSSSGSPPSTTSVTDDVVLAAPRRARRSARWPRPPAGLQSWSSTAVRRPATSLHTDALTAGRPSRARGARPRDGDRPRGSRPRRARRGRDRQHHRRRRPGRGPPRPACRPPSSAWAPGRTAAMLGAQARRRRRSARPGRRADGPAAGARRRSAVPEVACSPGSCSVLPRPGRSSSSTGCSPRSRALRRAARARRRRSTWSPGSAAASGRTPRCCRASGWSRCWTCGSAPARGPAPASPPGCCWRSAGAPRDRPHALTSVAHPEDTDSGAPPPGSAPLVLMHGGLGGAALGRNAPAVLEGQGSPYRFVLLLWITTTCRKGVRSGRSLASAGQPCGSWAQPATTPAP